MTESGPRTLRRFKGSAFLAFASFLMFQGGFTKPAEAQTQATPPTERQVLLYGIAPTVSNVTQENDFTAPNTEDLMTGFITTLREESPEVAPAAAPETDDTDTSDPNTETIIVTAQRPEDFSMQTDPQFEGNFFTRNGITAVHNPNLDGLAYRTREEELEAESWNAVRFHLGGSQEGDRGAFFDLEAGRGHGVRTGWRF